jgi:hypothetical protein
MLEKALTVLLIMHLGIHAQRQMQLSKIITPSDSNT